MHLDGVIIGLVFTGSHCTMDAVLTEVEHLRNEGARIIPVFSYTVAFTDNRFHSAGELKEKVMAITGETPIESITEAEPIGPGKRFDILVVAPCTGNTLAKLAQGITDTPALMAIKAHMRNQRPVVIAIATNDGLGVNARNLGYLLNAKNIYFVPFRQDNYREKANSLVARVEFMAETIKEALQGRQLHPVLLGPDTPV